MSESYNLERQNNSRLDELSSKVSALRGVTVNIYDNAREQGVIDSSVRLLSPLSLHYLPHSSLPPSLPLSLHLPLPKYPTSKIKPCTARHFPTNNPNYPLHHETKRSILQHEHKYPLERRATRANGAAGE